MIFPLTTEDALAFAVRHHLQSILRTENSGIDHRRRHPQHNGNAEVGGKQVIDSNWILFRNPSQIRRRFTAFSPLNNKLSDLSLQDRRTTAAYQCTRAGGRTHFR